jgi:predicted metal-dependent enzyme (double-stranded beta helix superfamily)
MFDLDAFLAQCISARRETEPRLAVRDVLDQALVDGGLADAFAATTHGIELLHHDDDLTVLNVVWPPLFRIYPHDHHMWAAIAIYGGQEDNVFFRRQAGTLQSTGGKVLREGDVRLLGDDAIHAVANPTRGYTGAIHVYGGDLMGTPRSQWRGEPPLEEPYDIDSVRREFDRAQQRFVATSA